jgi:GTP pyrophosphokinase
MNELERAIEVAVTVHAGQTDKAGATYIRHPLRVMQQMDTETERVVAVLHDVVEDTPKELDDIEHEFGPTIHDAVAALTKRDDETEQYQQFIDRVADNDIARKVKIADIEDNMDLTRLSDVNDAVLENQEKYHRAWQRL